MSEDTLYRKQGRRYIPERTLGAYDGLPEGHYLIYVKPGSTSIRYTKDPDYAALLAAAEEMEAPMLDAMFAASKLRPGSVKHTPKQHKAYLAYIESLGKTATYFTYASLQDILDAGMEVLIEKARQQ